MAKPSPTSWSTWKWNIVLTRKLAVKWILTCSVKLENITEDTYEVQSCKSSIKLNLPIQVGFFVDQYAKLCMMQFYYDFLDEYLERADF